MGPPNGRLFFFFSLFFLRLNWTSLDFFFSAIVQTRPSSSTNGPWKKRGATVSIDHCGTNTHPAIEGLLLFWSFPSRLRFHRVSHSPNVLPTRDRGESRAAARPGSSATGNETLSSTTLFRKHNWLLVQIDWICFCGNVSIYGHTYTGLTSPTNCCFDFDMVVMYWHFFDVLFSVYVCTNQCFFEKKEVYISQLIRHGWSSFRRGG